MIKPTPISFDNFYKFVDMNKDNNSLIYDINDNYFKNRNKISYNKNKFLNNLDDTFINKDNLLNKSIHNIMNFTDFGIISIEEFFTNLNIILNNITEKIDIIFKNNKNNKNNRNIYIYYSEINKSNCWLSMILCKFLKKLKIEDKEFLIFINNNIFFIDDHKLIDTNDEPNIFFIDDCSYSGRQLEQNISCFYEKKNITIFVFCVYISTYAYNKLITKFINKFNLINYNKLSNICNNYDLMKLLVDNFYIFTEDITLKQYKIENGKVNFIDVNKSKILINTLDYLDIYLKNVIYKILEIKSADYLSIIQNLYNYIRPISFNIVDLNKIKIYKLKDELKKKILEDVKNNIFCDTEYIDIFNISLQFPKDIIIILDNIILSNIELYNDDTNTNYKNINTITINNEKNKVYGLLDNCSNELYKTLKFKYNNEENNDDEDITFFQSKKGAEYQNDELCYSAYYRKEPLIIKDEVLQFFNNNCLNEQNIIFLQKLSSINKSIISGGMNKINLINKYIKYFLFK